MILNGEEVMEAIMRVFGKVFKNHGGVVELPRGEYWHWRIDSTNKRRFEMMIQNKTESGFDLKDEQSI